MTDPIDVPRRRRPEPADDELVGATAKLSSSLSLKEAAAELGVHYQTAYKWVRTHELPATVIGGAYRVDRQDLERCAQNRVRPVAVKRRVPRAGFSAYAARMFDDLINGEDQAVKATVERLVTEGLPVTTVLTEVVVPALARIGSEWRAGRLGIVAEHRASAMVERVVADVYPNRRGRRRGTAVVAALSGDHHAIPTLLASTCLREENWKVHHLGADLPEADLVDFCRSTEVDLVVLTVTNTTVLPSVESCAARLESLGIRVLVGGPGRGLEELQGLARASGGVLKDRSAPPLGDR